MTSLFHNGDRIVSAIVNSDILYDRGLSRLLNTELHWLDVPERVKYMYKLSVRGTQLSERPSTPVPDRLLHPTLRSHISAASQMRQPTTSGRTALPTEFLLPGGLCLWQWQAHRSGTHCHLPEYLRDSSEETWCHSEKSCSYNIWSTTRCPCWHTTSVSQAWWTWTQKRSPPCQAFQVVSNRKMSPSHAFNGGSKIWQNLISISVQDYYRHTTTFCFRCQHLQPAFGFQLGWWGNWHLAQPISANGHEVRGTRSCKWTGITVQQSPKDQASCTRYRLLLSTMLGNDVQLWLYWKKKTTTTTTWRMCEVTTQNFKH